MGTIPTGRPSFHRTICRECTIITSTEAETSRFRLIQQQTLMKGDLLMKSTMKTIVAGVLLAVLVIRIFYTFSMPVSYHLFAIFLSL